MSKASRIDARANRAQLTLYHLLLLGAVFAFWYLMTTPLLVSEEFATNTAFFFGKPLMVLQRIWDWFAGGKIYEHLVDHADRDAARVLDRHRCSGSALGCGWRCRRPPRRLPTLISRP